MASQITRFGEQAFVDIDDVELDPEGARILDRLRELDEARGRIEAELSERMVAYSDHVRQRAMRHRTPVSTTSRCLRPPTRSRSSSGSPRAS